MARQTSHRAYHRAPQTKRVVTRQSQRKIIITDDRQTSARVHRLNEENTNFEDAVAKFQEFLKTNQYSGEITWVQPGDVLLTGKRQLYIRVSSQEARQKMARTTYEDGMPRRRGVLFRTICDLGSTTCSHVRAPASDEEAQRLLMPAGLKLSVQTEQN
jgi:hypothetical protein